MMYFNRMMLIPIVLIMGCTENKFPIELNTTSDQAELFGEGFISTHLYERDMAISPDGNEIIYTLGNYKQTRRTLISIKKGENGWEDRDVLPFSGRYQDIEPFFSVDGEKLFFASTRPTDSDTTRSDYNIWVSEKSGPGWGEPSPLDTVINTLKDEFYPAVSKNGNLYFTATRENGIGREDIFLSRFGNGEYQLPTPLDSTINTAVFEFNAYVSPDENLLVFSSFGRDDGLGGGDLYYSVKDTSGNWIVAKNLGAVVNSDKLDYCPFVDIPHGNFYFTSDRTNELNIGPNTVSDYEKEALQVLNGMGNIYRVNIETLDLK